MQRNNAARAAVLAGQHPRFTERRNVDILKAHTSLTYADIERIETISNQRAIDSLVVAVAVYDTTSVAGLPGWRAIA